MSPTKIPTGYKQTEIGVIPEDWDVKKLRNIVSEVIDNRGKTPPYSSDEDIELIETASISFVNRYPDYSRVTKFVSREVYNNWFRGHPMEKDILISTVGEYSGSSAIMEKSRGTIAQNLVALRIKEVSPTYVFYWTRSANFKMQLDQVMMNQAQPSLRVPWLLNFCLSIPKTESEQTAIVSALSDIDALITSFEKLIAKKRSIKQGAMQELLTGKRRLPGFSGKWEMKKLGKLLKIKHGKSQKEVRQEDGLFPIVATSGVIGQASQPLYSKPSVLIGRKGTIDKPQYFDIPFWAIDTIFYSEIFDCADTKFIFYRFNLIDWQNYNEASGVPSLNARTIENIEINIPVTKNEQTAIAKVLDDIDSEINKMEQQLAKYKMLKQGMMQVLLTGKVRLI